MSADEAARARDKGDASDAGTEAPEASRLSKIAAGALDVSVLAGAAAPVLLALASGGSIAAALTTIAGGVGSSRCETVLKRVADRLCREDSQQVTEAGLRDLLETEYKSVLPEDGASDELAEEFRILATAVAATAESQTEVLTEIRRQQQMLASLESDQREDQQQIVNLLQTVIDLLQGAPAPAARSGSPSGYDPTVVPLPLLVPTAGSGSAVTTDSGSETRWTKGAEVPIGGTTYMLRGELLCETFSDTDGTYHRQASAIQSRPPRVRPSERYAWLEQVAPGGVPATTSGAQRCLTEKYELSKRLGRSPALPRTRRLVEDGTTRTLVTGWPVRRDGERATTLAADHGLDRADLATVNGANLTTLPNKPAPMDTWRLHGLCLGLAAVCSAVAELHDRDLSHRALHPWSVLVVGHDRMVLRDLGLAASPPRPGEAPAAHRAPEQQQKLSSRPGPPTDVYQVAATAYHLITGQAPQSSRPLPLQEVSAVPRLTEPLAKAIDASLRPDALQRPPIQDLGAWFAEAGKLAETARR